MNNVTDEPTLEFPAQPRSKPRWRTISRRRGALLAAGGALGAAILLVTITLANSGGSADGPSSLASYGGAGGGDLGSSSGDPAPDSTVTATTTPPSSSSPVITTSMRGSASRSSNGSTAGGSSGGASNGSGGPNRSASVPAPPENAAETQPAQQLLQLINAARAKAGCGQLTWNPGVAQVAYAHSADMGINGYFSHNSQNGADPFKRLAAAGFPNGSGENIGAGYTTALAEFNGWMGDAMHKGIMLSCTEHEVGIGFYNGPHKGPFATYWTADFLY